MLEGEGSANVRVGVSVPPSAARFVAPSAEESLTDSSPAATAECRTPISKHLPRSVGAKHRRQSSKLAQVVRTNRVVNASVR